MKSLKADILVVDDNAIIHSLFESLGSLHKLKVECVKNGQKALDILREKEFSVILMDLEMPVMGGLEATRIIRQREKEKQCRRTPIIAISGTIMSNPYLQCHEAGMDDFIAKPIVMSSVLDVIMPLVEKNSSVKEDFTQFGAAI